MTGVICPRCKKVTDYSGKHIIQCFRCGDPFCNIQCGEGDCCWKCHGELQEEQAFQDELDYEADFNRGES